MKFSRHLSLPSLLERGLWGEALLFLIILTSCSHDAFDTGDGTYSYLRTDFAEVYTDGQGAVARAMTDEGDSLLFSPTQQVSWAAIPDSVYRALVYYEANVGTAPSPSQTVVTVKPFSIGQVMVLRPFVTKEGEQLPTDPLTFESAWLSSNGRYLNLGLAVKTGTTEGIDTRQSLGMAVTAIEGNASGGQTYHLQLAHNQNAAPEYYSASVYTSIPLGVFPSTLPSEGIANPKDSIRLTINSYKGTVVRVFGL